MLPFLTDEAIFKTQNYFVTVAELLAAAVISMCLSVGAGFHLLPVQADEPTAGPSGISVGVQSSPASLLPDGVTTRKEADEWNADLIVVGTHGRSALGRLLMGSVSQKVAAESHCSVRVARYPAEKSESPIRIVVGVDGSSSALVALREVALRAWPAGSEALVIAATNYREPSGTVPMPSAAPKAALERTAEDETLSPQNMIEIAGEDLRAVAGLHVLSQITEGNPKSVLISEAKTFEADCIFVGSRGSNSRLERHTLGSVSGAVANGAHCSVEVVRARRTPGVT